MEHIWDPDAMRWIPKEQPFSRPKPRQVNRHMLLRGLAEEVVYEDTIAQLYAGLLVGVICDGNPTAKREYERMLAQEWQKAKSFVKPSVLVESAALSNAVLRMHPADQ